MTVMATRACAVACLLCISLAHAAVIETTDAAVIAAFQAGATVVNFESVAGRTPTNITAYNDTDAVAAASRVFNEIAGVEFSVGGTVGTDNAPALLTLGVAIAGDATSGETVLGPTQMGATPSGGGLTNFGGFPFIEVYFPTKVSRVGFWLNPSLSNISILVSDNKVAFNPGPGENVLENGTGSAGRFIMIERPTAEIGGLTLLTANAIGFTIDDLTFGSGTAAVPEPHSIALLSGGLLLLAVRRRQLR